MTADTPQNTHKIPPFAEAMAKNIVANPFCHAIGMELIGYEPSRVRVKVPYRTDLTGGASGVIAGGVVTTLLDNACGSAAALALEDLNFVATINLRLDYMRAATPGLDIEAEGECYKVTRNVAFVRAIAFERDRNDPIAHCVSAFMISPLSRPAQDDQMPEPETSAADFSQASSGLLSHIPYAVFLGAEAIEQGDRLIVTAPMKPMMLGNYFIQALHGGFLGSMLELAAIAELARARESEKVCKPIDVQVEYLRSAKGSLPLYASARVVRIGRRVAHVQAHAWQEAEEKPVAILHANYLVDEAAM